MVFDQALRRKPSVAFAPEYDPHTQPDDGRIQALFYEGMAYHGKSTRVFAYLGVPNGAERAPVPAVVLVHGGGGHAYYEWVRRWVAKGYAAIAMDTEGYFPADAYKGLAGGFEGEPPETYTRFDASDAYASIPSAAIAGVRVCEHPDTPLEDQWLYHAVSVVLMAQTVLKNDSRVQADRIGICGISWGSVISSIAIGQGSGFAFAVNIYGSAYLEHSLAGIMQAYHRISSKNYQNPTATVQNITCPVLWLCWNNDQCFSLLPNSLSYAATHGRGARLCIKNDWSHSHAHAWWVLEPYWFADYAWGKTDYLDIVEEEYSGNVRTWRLVGADPVKSVRVYYLTEPMRYSENSWMLNEWQTVEATVDGETVTALLPDGADSYYLEVIVGCAAGRYTVCSEFRRLEGDWI